MHQLNENMFIIRHFNKRNQKYTQKDLSEILNIPQTRISRIENGDIPKLYDVIKYADFFNIKIDDLIFKKYNRNTKNFE